MGATAKGDVVTLVLIERTSDSFGDYETRWMCEPPPFGMPVTITRQEWSDDYTVRVVHAWVEADPRWAQCRKVTR